MTKGRVERFQALLAREGASPKTCRAFRDVIYSYFGENARAFPWRETREPYRILVSEVMLQQTQTERVMEKYGEFINAFPDFASLAEASKRDVLEKWQGLGYNRRALTLKEAASIVTEKHGGKLPQNPGLLMALPGVGRSTASAVCAFAFGMPVVFLETNIRRVFIHFFFHDRETITDREILPLVEKTLHRADPRSWYLALMDYGAMLKKQVPNPNRKSAHYKKQAPFEGSERQMRGNILRVLVLGDGISEKELSRELGVTPGGLKKALAGLEKEGFLKRKGAKFIIK